MRLLSRLLIPLGLLGAVMAAFAFLQLDSAALLSLSLIHISEPTRRS